VPGRHVERELTATSLGLSTVERNDGHLGPTQGAYDGFSGLRVDLQARKLSLERHQPGRAGQFFCEMPSAQG